MDSKYLWNLNVEAVIEWNIRTLVILYFHLLILFITSNYLVERGSLIKWREREDKIEAVAQRVSIKKVLLEILRNSHENSCIRVSFLRKPFVTEDLRWLLLTRLDFMKIPCSGRRCKISKILQLLTPLQLTYREQGKRSTKSFTPP